MKTSSIVIEKEPVFLSCKRLKIPENNSSCVHGSTKINICHTDNSLSGPGLCFVNGCKDCCLGKPFIVKNDFSHLLRGSERSNIPPLEHLKYLSLIKVLAVFFVICDIIYLHINLRNVDISLQHSVKLIENLESQLKFSKTSYETFKADVNYLMYLDRMLSKDINSKIELLIKLNQLFMDHADSSLNSIIDVLRNQKNNDNEILHIVKKRNASTGFTNYSESNVILTVGEDKSNKSDFQEDPVLNNSELTGDLNYNNFESLFHDLNHKNNLDSIIGLENITVGSLPVPSHDLRFKRQATNNSRSNNRGKQNGKLKKRGHHRHINCNLFCCSAGPLLAHFRGAQPEALIQDGGVIAPWFGDLDASGDYFYRNFVLREGKAKVEVSEKGLYLIYAQVYYLTSSSLNSFSINVQGEKEDSERVIALCSTEAAVQGLSEVSCYTSVVRQLQPGDKVFLLQRERYRRVLFREGHTFLGIVALNNPPKC